MKKFKYGFSAVLALLLLACTVAGAADTSAVEQIRAAQEQAATAESYTAALEMSLTIALNSTSIDMTMTGHVNAFTSPMKVHTTMQVETMGEATGMDQYIVEQNGAIDVYTRTQSEGYDSGWAHATSSPDALLSSYDIQASMDIYAQNADSFEFVGDEDVNGRASTKYTGMISGSSLAGVLKGALSDLGLSAGLSGDETMALIQSGLDGSGSMPVSVWLDRESNTPRRYTMDMTNVLSAIFDSLLGGLGDSVPAMSVEGCTLRMDITSMNMTEDFEVLAVDGGGEDPEAGEPDGEGEEASLEGAGDEGESLEAEGELE